MESMASLNCGITGTAGRGGGKTSQPEPTSELGSISALNISALIFHPAASWGSPIITQSQGHVFMGFRKAGKYSEALQGSGSFAFLKVKPFSSFHSERPSGECNKSQFKLVCGTAPGRDPSLSPTPEKSPKAKGLYCFSSSFCCLVGWLGFVQLGLVCVGFFFPISGKPNPDLEV